MRWNPCVWKHGFPIFHTLRDGIRGGGVTVNILQIKEGQTCLIYSRGRVTVFFAKENIIPCRLVDYYLLHLTSWIPRILHKRISLFLFLGHPCPFSSFHHATPRNWLLCAQTRLCEQHLRSVISTSGYFVLLEVGEGQMLLFRYLWRVMHKSNLGSGTATNFLAKNF